MFKKLLFALFLISTTIAFSQKNSIEKLTAAPNPFTHSTTITFSAVKKSTVIFTVKNVLGKTVYKTNLKTVVGKNSIPFSKGSLKTGIYIYSLQNEKNIISKRIVIK
ncbi:T9SS type A sorting domain-containing protein [Polaribacter porphyrae]|uniref:Secretion system C-terminal sorting domain-containing protein n=1 Tax=Polaribacter porphyrae TaxID=1137780 RepID=A0A2S7WJW9_9FLAO|nr:T9SS type A sorting domain-containing protein [Polaribacter porphyrae]PQJ77873.1 hypothetical protein BTO18_01145 [Polaribacter porphyrae]